MGDIFNKKFFVATCQHCGKSTNISMSKDVNAMVVQNRTLKEVVRLKENNLRRVHAAKNGQIQAMHKMIGQIMELLTPEQKEKVKKLNQPIKDEIKRLMKTKFDYNKK